MKRYRIIHRTYYNYTDTVVLGAHELLLRPREGHDLRIESFLLNITPDAKVYWHRDVEGNSVAVANFTKPAQQLTVESEVIIQQFNESPLDFIVADYAINYPFNYDQRDQFLLSPYRVLPDQETRELLNNWIFGIWKNGEQVQTYTLLQRITAAIYTTLVYTIREEPGVQSAKQTLSLGSGSCRDLALLFMESGKMFRPCLSFCQRILTCATYV
jgi:transglutaminase-like putative cysteine protease